MTDKPIRPAASYALIVPQLVEAVRPLGYALTLHGSLCRDLDLVAIPWADDAADPELVVDAIVDAIGGWRLHKAKEPHKKPHGRLVYSVHFKNANGNSLPDNHPYIDLSVMPRAF